MSPLNKEGAPLAWGPAVACDPTTITGELGWLPRMILCSYSFPYALHCVPVLSIPPLSHCLWKSCVDSDHVSSFRLIDTVFGPLAPIKMAILVPMKLKSEAVRPTRVAWENSLWYKLICELFISKCMNLWLKLFVQASFSSCEARQLIQEQMISCTLDVQRCSLPCRGCCALWSENDGLRLIWSHVNSRHFHLIYQLGVKNVSRWAGPREWRSPILTLQCCCCCPPPVSSQWPRASIQGLPLMLICKLAIL